MRTRLERLERLVCAEHCRFYKPWRENQGRCSAVQWLFETGGSNLLDALERLRGRHGVGGGEERSLLRAVCSRCPHSAASCGFAASNPRPGALPCGGLSVISELLQRGDLALEDLYHSAPRQPEAAKSSSVGLA